MDAEDDGSRSSEELTSRAPEEQDLVKLCRRLNELGAEYLVCGGFAIIYGLYSRTTGDIDLLVNADVANERRVYKALEVFSDKAVHELDPGDVAKYNVVRVADEVVIDLMRAAAGIAYHEGSKDVVMRDVDGVPIPFASPRLLWRMKKPLNRPKDAADLVALEQYFRARGEEPPAV